ncbi:MAG: hypothetical protein ACREOG_22750 [Gemmatimonadaceae bacterium]
MRRLHSAAIVSLATAVVVLVAESPSLAPPLDRHIRHETERLQAHFDSVDVELAARNMSALSQEQRGSRTQLVAWLREYRDAATFPLNNGVSPRTVPIFRDARGVLCAMAYLIQRSGRGDLVADIAASRNTAYIGELADDPRLIAWLDSTGLSVDEAARIQPAYGPYPPPTVVVNDGVSASYALTSLALSGSALAMTGVNVMSPSRLSGLLGFVAGTVAMVNGVTRLDESRATRRVAAANTGIGALSMAMAFRGIISSRSPGRPPIAAKLNNVELAPTVALLGSPQLGFALRARF